MFLLQSVTKSGKIDMKDLSDFNILEKLVHLYAGFIYNKTLKLKNGLWQRPAPRAKIFKDRYTALDMNYLCTNVVRHLNGGAHQKIRVHLFVLESWISGSPCFKFQQQQ